MDVRSCVGTCLPLFVVAIIFDLTGVILLFIGIFANVKIGGLFYGDFLIYSGSIIIFFSLGFWLMWYVGNIRVLEYDGETRRSSLALLARKISERLNQTLKGEDRRKYVEDGGNGQVGLPRKPSKITWDDSTAHINKGYDDSTDSPDVEKKIEVQM